MMSLRCTICRIESDWHAIMLRNLKIINEIYEFLSSTNRSTASDSPEHWMQTGEDRDLKTSQNVLEKRP